MKTATKLSRTELRLLREGYDQGPPVHLDEASQLIDAALCEEMDCPTCHHAGHVYRPFHRGRSYRAAAVCPKCNHSQEV